jgi:hypothetical protein
VLENFAQDVSERWLINLNDLGVADMFMVLKRQGGFMGRVVVPEHQVVVCILIMVGIGQFIYLFGRSIEIFTKKEA